MDRRSFLKTGTVVAATAPKTLAALTGETDQRTSHAGNANVYELPFFEDFSGFPAGALTHPIGQLNGAIQEYHYLQNRGVPLGRWINAIAHMDAWVVSDEDGKPYIEQHLVNALAKITNPIFLTGDPAWVDYVLEVKLKPLSLANFAGVVFRYHTNRHYCLFALTGGAQARLAVRLPLEKTLRMAEWRELATADFPYDTKRYHALKIENSGPHIRAYVDGKPILEAEESELLRGKAGITANVPARFQEFSVAASPSITAGVKESIATRKRSLARLQDENPQPKLWKRFTTPKFGAGRSMRLGDLDGDGRLEILIAQNVPRVSGDAHDQISCLTAVNLDGKVLWQSGRPDPRNGLLTNDLPFQIHDIDGDGRNEVVLIRDFKLQIWDGNSGKPKRWAWMPQMTAANSGVREPYELENGDSVAFVNVSGGKERRDILVKDRYKHFWIFNNDLQMVWHGEGQTGHFPYPFDIDGDGRDEFLIGYSLWDHDGRRLWSHDEDLKDHADAVSVGNFSGDPKAEPGCYACGSDEGFLVFSIRGELLKHVRIGHAQSCSWGKYRPDLPGLQCMTVNFWRNPGIVTLFDHDGNILGQEEPIHSGSPMLPVNWRGDGQEFVLLSGNVHEGGMLDGNLRRVVMFPNDGHPDLCAQVTDLTGDERDEVILWDQEQVWIYTQDRPFAGKRIYAPSRNPHYNESNYRTNVSMPAWKDLRSS